MFKELRFTVIHGLEKTGAAEGMSTRGSYRVEEQLEAQNAIEVIRSL